MKTHLRIIALTAFIIILFAGCKSSNDNRDNVRVIKGNPTELAVMYTQTSGEYAAICYQTFAMGKMIFNMEKEKCTEGNKKLAVVVDVDETVLDNTPYQVEMIIQSSGYPDQWDQWCNFARALAMPGALEFCKYIESHDGVVFYVTNRKDHLKAATVKNLQDKGFPFADDEHVMTRSRERSKEPRRDIIKKDHEIVLLMGDNLNDLTNIFENKDAAARKMLVKDNQQLFGTRFLVFPNPMYGDWENPVYKEVGFSATPEMKHEARMKIMKGF